MIEGAITLLCIPNKNNITEKKRNKNNNNYNGEDINREKNFFLPNIVLDIVKKRWLQRDCENDMEEMAGSVSQYQAPTAVQILITSKITEKKIFFKVR